MTIKTVTEDFSAAPQLTAEAVVAAAAQGFKTIVNTRPDGEERGQPDGAEIARAAEAAGLRYIHIPVVPGTITDAQIEAFEAAFAAAGKPVLGFCRSGTRAISLYALSQAGRRAPAALLADAEKAGYDLQGLAARLEARAAKAAIGATVKTGPAPGETFDVLIVGGGAAGIAVAASLIKRRPETRIAIIEPAEQHWYQAAFTLVGGGVFKHEKTVRPEAKCMPSGVQWIRAAASAFEPEHSRVVLEDGDRVGYRYLVVCPGLKLDWDRVDGLWDTLGKNGVTSNYKPGLAPYTWELLQGMKSGTALFTQPPMPIKCAGAPQKIMYLACDYWRRQGVLDKIDVEFNNAGGVLFGVEPFVSPLMEYVRRYGADLAFNSNLVAIDGAKKVATFAVTKDGKTETVAKPFDMIHVTPPQTAPNFVKASPLADEGGWVAVDQETLRSTKFANVYGLGDVCSAPNAKTAAAVRKQSPVVVRNLMQDLDGGGREAVYHGYGACPLTVERGKVILAEFGYGGALQPTLPLNPRKPRWIYWLLKVRILPFMYWSILFRGHEWGAVPKLRPAKAKTSAPAMKAAAE
jgi:sulfide:quinone oxidoreductase